VAAKEIAVKKYVVRLSADERVQLNDLIHKGKRSAQLLTKARILLKADVSEAGEGWSDSRIAAALDTSIATIQRTRRQLVEEGFESVLTRKYNANSARPRIFGGAAEAKLIALTCGLRRQVMPNGACACSRRKSSNCRLLSAPATTRSDGLSKKHSQTAPEATMGHCARCQRGLCG